MLRQPADSAGKKTPFLYEMRKLMHTSLSIRANQLEVASQIQINKMTALQTNEKKATSSASQILQNIFQDNKQVQFIL